MSEEQRTGALFCRGQEGFGCFEMFIGKEQEFRIAASHWLSCGSFSSRLLLSKEKILLPPQVGKVGFFHSGYIKKAAKNGMCWVRTFPSLLLTPF